MKWGNEILARPGDVKCVIVESEKDVPDDEEINRRWINVDKCQPIVDPEPLSSARVILLSYSKWDDLSPDQQTLYLNGFLETISFLMYGESPRNADTAQTFSDWTACAEREQPNRWKPMVDWLFGKLDQTAASQYFKMAQVVCEKYPGKGDKTWNPVKLISKGQWSSLSLRDKEIYVTAYVETADDWSRRSKQTANVRRLENCIGKDGVAKIMNTIKNTPIEWQYPLPWSVSVAVGKACP
jgi:hypothetical protein